MIPAGDEEGAHDALSLARVLEAGASQEVVEAAKAGLIVFGTILGLIKAIIVLVFIGLLVLIAVLLILPWISRPSNSSTPDV